MSKKGAESRIISVDVGSGFTQFTDGKNEGDFPSIVCPVPDVMGFGTEQALTVTFEGKRFLIGEDAKAYGDPDTRANTLHDDWAGSSGWKALLYAALAHLDVQDGETINLITGIPQSLFTQKRPALMEALTGQKTFHVQDRQINVNIYSEFIPQAAGALFFQASQDQEILQEAVGVIDVGTYTTGFSVISGDKFTSHRSGGCPIGMSQLLKALKDHLAKDGFRVDEANLPDILMSKSFRFRGERVDLPDQVVNSLALRVADPMLRQLKTKWQGGDDLLVYVAGGGAPYFIEAIQTSVPHAKVMSDSFYAVVRGMRTYLEAKLTAKAA